MREGRKRENVAGRKTKGWGINALIERMLKAFLSVKHFMQTWYLAWEVNGSQR